MAHGGLLYHGQRAALQVEIIQRGKILQGQRVAIQVQHPVYVFGEHPSQEQPGQGA